MAFKIVDPAEVSTQKLHGFMLASVAPRPIAFVSTIDKEGNVNLAPYSFFNAFGSNPPTLIFSPARRVQGNTIKHTLENVMDVKEAVVNVVNYSMVHQMSLASSEYAKGVNEFEKAGFTALPSEMVKPPRVAESPVQMECVVRDIIETGTEGGAGNLIICTIKLMHVDESVLNADGFIDQQKIDLVGRLGGPDYIRASGSSLFRIPKPIGKGIGVDAIPESIRWSKVLTGNDLGMLGNVEAMPTEELIAQAAEDAKVQSILSKENSADELHKYAHELLGLGKTDKAWAILMLNQN